MSSSLKPSIGPSGLAERIQSAIDRVTSGQATMRVPADASDPDLVLAECRTLVRALAARAAQAAAVAQECSDYATSLRSAYLGAKLQGQDVKSYLRAAELFEKAADALRTPTTPPSKDKQEGKHFPTPTLDGKAGIVDGCLIIRVPIETLAFAAQNSDYFFDAAENGEALVVSDQSNFAASVARALNVEAEDGSTPVTRMLDKATVWVVEQGEEGVDFVAKGDAP